jgi:hypothetical protein
VLYILCISDRTRAQIGLFWCTMSTVSQNLLSEIVSQFSTPVDVSIIGNIETFGGGHINNTYIVKYIDHDTNKSSERDLKIIQEINTRIFKDVGALTDNIAAICAHLKSKDVKTLQLVPLKSSPTNYIYHDQSSNSHWRMFDFIPQSRTAEEVPSIEDAYQAAKEFGNFQFQLLDFPVEQLHETIPNFHNTQMRYEQFLAAVERDVCSRVVTHRLLDSLVPFVNQRRSLSTALSDLQQHHNVPLRVVHNDTKLNNVLLHTVSGAGLCVIDLDTVMPGLTLYDFGDMVRTAANSCVEDEPDSSRAGIDLDLFRAVVRGYLHSAMVTEGGLLPVEIGHLVTAAKVLGQSIAIISHNLAHSIHSTLHTSKQHTSYFT